MEKVLIGAGGFAREIKAHMNNSEMLCFVDDEYYTNIKYLRKLSEFDPLTYTALIAVGDPTDRFNIIQKLPKNTTFFSFIHPSAQILDSNIEIGEGSIICAGSILTTNIKIGKHSHLNLHTTIGHDCIIGDYFTTAPGAKVSGNCNIGNYVYLGTNSSVRQKIKITNSVTVGLNAGVVKNIIEPGTYAGIPAKLISKK